MSTVEVEFFACCDSLQRTIAGVTISLRTVIALAALAVSSAAHAGSAESLSCIEKMFNDDRAKAMADLGSGDEAKAKAAEAKANFLMLGFGSRICARENGWSNNQSYNAIGYMMAWPTMRGLQLQGAGKGYDAIERAWSRHAKEWADKARLDDAQVALVLNEARADGLKVPAGDPGEKDAGRYANVLQQVAAMRDDFANNRKPRSLKD